MASHETQSCGACTHFENTGERERLVQLSIRGQGTEDSSVCGHPSRRPLRLRVRTDERCGSFEPGRRAG